MAQGPPSEPRLYHPLDEGSIRLLQLDGTCLVDRETSDGQPSGLQDLAITCTLSHHALADVRQGRVAYHALSYVWGHPNSAKRHLVCNGVKMLVKANLYDALWQLTFDGKHTAPLWIDAICINQVGDVPEKNRQLGLMADIYHEAELVIVWLGTCPELVDVDGFWRAMSRDSGWGSASHRQKGAGTNFVDSSNWFTRVWTFQEIVLARKAEVRCGPWRVEWKALSSELRASKRLEEIRQIQDPSSEPKSRLELADLLYSTRYRLASEPCDKIYALLGLVDHSIKIDYSKSAMQVRADAMLEILKQSGWLCLNLERQIELSRALRPELKETCFCLPFARPLPVTWIPSFQDDQGHGYYHGYPADYRGIHASLAMSISVEGTDLVAYGAILGLWSSGSRHDGTMSERDWSYDGRPGNFFRFPKCIEPGTDLTMDADPDQPKLCRHPRLRFPANVDAKQVYLKLHSHVSKVCSCFPHNQTSSLAPDSHRFAWLCLIFGNDTPVVLCPRFDVASRCLKLRLVNILPKRPASRSCWPDSSLDLSQQSSSGLRYRVRNIFSRKHQARPADCNRGDETCLMANIEGIAKYLEGKTSLRTCDGTFIPTTLVIQGDIEDRRWDFHAYHSGGAG